MGALIGFGFLIGGILAINWALQVLWRPFMPERSVADDPASADLID